MEFTKRTKRARHHVLTESALQSADEPPEPIASRVAVHPDPGIDVGKRERKKPGALHDYAQIPRELRRRRQWVAYRQEYNPDQPEKPAKVPYCAPTKRASHADRTTWLSYRDARELAQTSGFAGIGFVFSEKDPFVGIDLDGCRNPRTGELARWAKRIVSWLRSYTEVSQSGTGLHIIVRGELPKGIRHKFNQLPAATGDKKAAIEVYDRTRYFVVTGLIYKHRRRISHESRGLERLTSKYLTPAVRGTYLDAPYRNVHLRDDEVIERTAAANPSEFHRLFVAGETRSFKTPSESDFQLACMFAECVGGDAERIGRLMRRSALNRPKWHAHGAYVERTIAAAINDVAPRTPSLVDASERRFFATLRGILSRPELMTKPDALIRMVAWPGRVTLFAGPEKRAGKSTFLSAAAGRVAHGRPFLDAPTVDTPGKVLWVSADEEHTADIATRFVALGARRNGIAVLYPSGSLSERLAELERTVDLVRPTLVIVDTLSNFARVRDPFASTEWPEVILPLKRLARTRGTAIVLVHHTSKKDPETYRDSTSIGATVDQIVTLFHGKGMPSTHRRLSSLGRLTGGEQIRIQFLNGRRFAVALNATATLEERLIGFISEHEGASKRAIEKAMGGDRRRVRKTRQDLERRGLIAWKPGDRGAHSFSLSASTQAGMTRPVRRKPAR